MHSAGNVNNRKLRTATNKEIFRHIKEKVLERCSEKKLVGWGQTSRWSTFKTDYSVCSNRKINRDLVWGKNLYSRLLVTSRSIIVACFVAFVTNSDATWLASGFAIRADAIIDFRLRKCARHRVRRRYARMMCSTMVCVRFIWYYWSKLLK